MKIKDAVRYLNKNINQDVLSQSYFEKIGLDVNCALQVMDGYDNDGIYKSDGDLYIENHNHGFCFLLKTANSLFEANQLLPIIDGDWYFSRIFLYAKGKDDYDEYIGEIPYGISFKDTVQNIIKKIGREPDFINKYILKWGDLEGINISLSSIDKGKPQIIIISKN